MLGLMQDWPLLCHRIIEHAAKYHGTQEVVTRSVEGPIHRTNYAEIHARAESIATARRALAAQPRVLMLDEPSMGLAPQVVAEILRLILRMRHELGLGILLVEQNAEAALRIADHACVLSLGKSLCAAQAQIS